MNTVKIVEEIRDYCITNGQSALLEYTKRFDKVELESLIFQIPNEIEVSEDFKIAIDIAIRNITKFHTEEHKRLTNYQNIETMPGIMCFKRFNPIENVGIYVPNGLFSSVLMTVILAKIAGCSNIIVCTPPRPSNEVIYTLRTLGIEKIYIIGGAQAIFAMAYGIGEVPRVDKIFGPGNEYVDTAKRMVSNEVAIDMPAGPSDVLVISDNGNPLHIALDLLAQLEHGKESRAWFLTNSEDLIEKVTNIVLEKIKTAQRREILEVSSKNLEFIKCESILDAIEKSNKIAPEHLILNVENPMDYIEKIHNAGSVFLGKYASESFGDYASGTNHVLPTNGFARSFAGLSVASFGKETTFQEITQVGFSSLAKHIELMAELEKLEFHGESVKMRQ